MILLALLLAATPVADTERAFAAAAQREGQWTAFRTYAAPDAIMFAPGMVQASAYLAGRRDPPVSMSWSPTRTLTACDGSLAWSSGVWNKAGQAGTYGTIWRSGPGGWSWIYDDGHDGVAPVGPNVITTETASCAGAPAAAAAPVDPDGVPLDIVAVRAAGDPGLVVSGDAPIPVTARLGGVLASGTARDRSLVWRLNALPDFESAAHLLRVWAWDGRAYRLAVLDLAGAVPPAPPAPPPGPIPPPSPRAKTRK